MGPQLNKLRPDEIKTKKISLGKLVFYEELNGAGIAHRKNCESYSAGRCELVAGLPVGYIMGSYCSKKLRVMI